MFYAADSKCVNDQPFSVQSKALNFAYTPVGKIYYGYTFSFLLFFFKEGASCKESGSEGESWQKEFGLW